jgi:amino acid adenylation domain-containing protein
VDQVSEYAAVQDLFSQTAKKFAGALAIDHGGKRVTYSELEAKVDRLADVLSILGVSTESIVGIFLSDPIGIISSMLATLKAGGVFCPLDPTFPEKRLQGMFATAPPIWCITRSKFYDKLKAVIADLPSAPEIVLLDDGPVSENHSVALRLDDPRFEDPPPSLVYQSKANAPCSIYFTSGSSGKPKAILGRLKGIDHFIRWEIETVGVGPGTRVSQLASPSFDGFLKDAFVPLCAGGVVCAPESRDVMVDPGRLIDWIDVEQVEVLHCVPSVFRALINQGLKSRYFEAMKYVVMAGELLYPSDVKRWMETFGPRIKILNVYGMTEVSIAKSCHEVKPEDVERSMIPVGKPIKGAAMMVVDPRGQPCSVGDVGEIYIRTPYGSFGYYREPELTKEVFIQNPFSDDPTDIVYKTGDYGRLLEDGNFEMLGRRDNQVKIRGIRIELGEIENLLRGHTAVGDVAVVDRDDGEGHKFLVAYVSMNNGAGTESLRQYLAEHLPGEMLPSAFVQLDRLPRTLNGKIDRQALPALDLMQAERESRDFGPRSPVEEIVAGIWCEVLKLSAVGRGDNFFNLGGHSLLVTHTILRVRDILKVELPIRSLFEAPTLAEFSKLIQEQIGKGKQKGLTAITTVTRDGELPLSYSQQRMWIFENLASGSASFHVPLGVRLKGTLNVLALEQTFSEIIRRHENLRTIFPAVNDGPVQIIQPPTTCTLPIVDLSLLATADREQQAVTLAQRETLRRFDLGKGPLLRLMLLRMGKEDHIVICTMHHIISDGQSFEVVISEMSQIYSALSQGQPSPLAELSIQYADYVAWQRKWLQGEALESRLAYWRKQLDDAPRRLSLPRRRTGPRVQSFIGAREDVNFSLEVLEGLRELSRREGVTLLMTMLSAFVVMLKYYTGEEDIVVGSSYANRDQPEAEKLIGILVNSMPLRVDLSGAITFKDVLRRVRAVCLDAYTYQIPPELLSKDFSSKGAETDHLFNVWFQLEREEREKLEMNGLGYEWYLVHKEETKFEMSALFAEHKDGLKGVIEYDVESFDEEMIAEMRQSYIGLLEQAIADPDRRL